jgi:hypothetical protein
VFRHAQEVSPCVPAGRRVLLPRKRQGPHLPGQIPAAVQLRYGQLAGAPGRQAGRLLHQAPSTRAALLLALLGPLLLGCLRLVLLLSWRLRLGDRHAQRSQRACCPAASAVWAAQGQADGLLMSLTMLVQWHAFSGCCLCCLCSSLPEQAGRGGTWHAGRCLPHCCCLC